MDANTDPQTRRLLYQLLYEALLGMRTEAYTRGDKPIFFIADLFHHFPWRLEQMERGELSAEEVLSELQVRAQEKGSLRWLEQAMDDARRSRFVREDTDREPTPNANDIGS